ncbi:hypothetical protein ACH4ZX_18180 [Streptomyces sp. NPDC020490]
MIKKKMITVSDATAAAGALESGAPRQNLPDAVTKSMKHKGVDAA